MPKYDNSIDAEGVAKNLACEALVAAQRALALVFELAVMTARFETEGDALPVVGGPRDVLTTPSGGYA